LTTIILILGALFLRSVRCSWPLLIMPPPEEKKSASLPLYITVSSLKIALIQSIMFCCRKGLDLGTTQIQTSTDKQRNHTMIAYY